MQTANVLDCGLVSLFIRGQFPKRRDAHTNLPSHCNFILFFERKYAAVLLIPSHILGQNVSNTIWVNQKSIITNFKTTTFLS
jgi:hypothetical protein